MPYTEKGKLPTNERWLYERRRGQILGLKWAMEWAEKKIAKIERSNRNLLASRKAEEPESFDETPLWEP